MAQNRQVANSPSAATAAASPRLRTAALIPEIRLWLLDDTVGLWDPVGGEYRSDSPPPFWAFAWAGGQALARYVLDHPQVVAGRTVLDLGCGGGLAAIAAAKAGARSVLAVDADPAAVESARRNAAANDVAVAAVLGEVSADAGTVRREADVVLAGDVCYSSRSAERIGGFARRAARRGSRVLFGDPDRSFLPALRYRTLAIYDIAVPFALEGTLARSTKVLEVDI